MKILKIILPIIIALSLGFFLGKNVNAPLQEGSTELITNSGKLSSEQIISYLEANASMGFGGKAFCEYIDLGNQEIGYLNYQSVKALCQEFYVENGSLIEGTGEVGPRVIMYKSLQNETNIIGHNSPRDGSYYADDIKLLFANPEEALKSPDNSIVEALEKKVDDRAKQYFNK